MRILQFPQIGIGIGDDIEFVVSRDAIKFQLHRRKIAVQSQLPGVGIEKIDVQVAYRVFIRRACYALHLPGLYGHNDPYLPFGDVPLPGGLYLARAGGTSRSDEAAKNNH